MKIKQRAFSLGFTERSGVGRDQKEYDLRVLSYVVEDDDTSRKFYVDKDNYALIRTCRDLYWGTWFEFHGEISGNGRITIEKIEKIERIENE